MSSGPVKILIVDDDYSSRRLLARIIRNQWSCTVIEADDGSEALRTIVKEAPDLVILDMIMPFMSGLEVLKTMRSHSKMAGVPVIVCTSIDQETEVAEIIKLGISDYVVKPIDRKLLIKKISDILIELKGEKIKK